MSEIIDAQARFAARADEAAMRLARRQVVERVRQSARLRYASRPANDIEPLAI